MAFVVVTATGVTGSVNTRSRSRPNPKELKVLSG